MQLELRTASITEPIEIDDDDEPPTKRLSVEPANKLTTIKIEPTVIGSCSRSAKRPKVELGNKSTTIKMEPIEIDDDEPPAKRLKFQAAINVEEDDELGRLEAEERKLAKEIEEEQRLRDMKRKHEALLEKIEAARERKAAR